MPFNIICLETTEDFQCLCLKNKIFILASNAGNLLISLLIIVRKSSKVSTAFLSPVFINFERLFHVVTVSYFK